MAGEIAPRDSGSGEGDSQSDDAEGGKVADTFRAFHDIAKDSTVAIQYPASGDRPGTVTLLHVAGRDDYTLVKIFDDRSIKPKHYNVKVDDEKVGLNAKEGMTRDDFEEEGAKAAAAWMRAQDILGLSIPTEEDELDFSRCFADMFAAQKEGKIERLDLSSARAA